jgi:hypothetical protein
MFGSHGRSALRSAKREGRVQRFVTTGILILSGVLLAGLILYFSMRGLKAKPPDVPVPRSVAELVSATGMVLVQTPGKAEWREVNSGASFVEGDLVRTDSSGGAVIRYQSGATVSISRNTVFTIQGSGDNLMEISASPGTAGVPPLLLTAENGTGTSGARRVPFVELWQIIPFGRSLELVGRIEAGSHLAVNDEIVEVSGDGSFKHFTRPFPLSANSAKLSLKVTDLAGRTRVWTATHDFRSHGGEE